MKKNRTYKAFELIAFLFVVGGLIAAGFICYSYSEEYTLIGKNVDENGSESFAALISGIVGPMFTMSSIILFYIALRIQHSEYKQQVQELKDTRKEFEINRLTTILYGQLDRFDKIVTINELQNFDGKKLPKGYPINFVEIPKNLELKKGSEWIDDECYRVSSNIHEIKMYEKEFIIFIEPMFQIFEAFKRTLNMSSLEEREIKELIALFRLNIDNKWFHFFKEIYFNIQLHEEFDGKIYQGHEVLETNLKEYLRGIIEFTE